MKGWTAAGPTGALSPCAQPPTTTWGSCGSPSRVLQAFAAAPSSPSSARNVIAHASASYPCAGPCVVVAPAAPARCMQGATSRGAGAGGRGCGACSSVAATNSSSLHAGACGRRQRRAAAQACRVVADPDASPYMPLLPGTAHDSLPCTYAAPGVIEFIGTTSRQLQSLIHGCHRPTIIDLAGRTIHIYGPPPPLAVAAPAGDSTDSAAGPAQPHGYGLPYSQGSLDLDRDDVIITNGTFMLHGDCGVRVSAHVALRGVHIENAEGQELWGPDPSAMLDVPPKPLVSICSGSLELEGCSISCANSARHLVQAGSSDSELYMTCCHLSGGCYACVAMPGATLRMEFCQLVDYSRIGLLASGARVNLTGSLFRPAGKAAVAVTVDEGGWAIATGCFVEGAHEADVMCTEGSRVELRGCKMGDAASRSGAAIFIESKGRGVLRDCDLANAASVRGARLALHGCNLALSGRGGDVAGHVFKDSVLTVDSCRSGRAEKPVAFRAARRGAAVIITNSPDVRVARTNE